MRIIAIRPEPGLSSTLAEAAARGLEVVGHPLSQVVGCAWELPDPAHFDAVLAGSANAFRHGGSQLQALTGLPVLAVGQATADAAATAGFAVAATGSGGLQTLLDEIGSRYRRLLRLAGEDHVPVSLPPGTELTTRVIYRIQNIEIPDELQRELDHRPVVLLHSAGAAAHFAAECDRLGIDRGRIALAAIGPRVLEAAGNGWGAACAAARPADAELLALAGDMCH